MLEEHDFEVEGAGQPAPVDIDADGFVIDDELTLASKENEGIRVHIRGADGKPRYYKEDGVLKPVIWLVAGAHSDLYRNKERELRQQPLSRKKLTGARAYTENIEKVAACVLSWDGMFSRKRPGAPLERLKLTPHNVKETLRRCDWVLNQIMEEMHDHEGFFENSSSEDVNGSALAQ